MQPVRTGDGKQPCARILTPKLGEGRLRFRRDCPLIGDGDARTRRRRHRPVGPGNHCSRVQRALRLIQLPRRQPQPDRRAVRLLHEVKGVTHEDREFIDIGRFEARQPVRGHAEQRRVDRLVLPAFRPERDAGRGGHQQKARILVACVDQRIEPAIDERVVHGADRQHPRTRQRRGKPGGAKQQEQILLGNAEFDVLPLRAHAPALRRRQLGVAKHVVAGMPVEYSAPVHPRAEIGRHRHVRARRHDVVGKFLVGPLRAADLGQDLTEAALGGRLAARDLGRRQQVGNCHDGRRQLAPLRRQLLGERHRVEERLHVLAGDIQPLEHVPFMAGPDSELFTEQLHLLLAHQPRVIVLMAGKRQSHAFDCIGNKAGRLVALGIGRAQGLDDRLDVVAAQIHHQFGQFVVRQRIQDAAHALGPAEVGQQRLAPGCAALEGQRRIQAVRAIIDPGAQQVPALPRERGLQLAAVFDRDDVPAHVAEQSFDPAEQPVRNHRIKALPVVVDDPPHVANVVLPAFQQRLVDIALVQFRIAADGDVPAVRQARARQAVQAHIVLHQRGKAGQRDAKPD